MTVDQKLAVKLKLIQGKIGTREMAKIMGVSPRSIDNWVQGRYPPGKPSLMLLEKYLEGTKK